MSKINYISAVLMGKIGKIGKDIADVRKSAAAGAPTKVTLVSQMTDTDKNYLYIGSETGYTSGHVYYYVDGNLTDGGAYGGVNIDNTLSVSGQAADAKVTGDEIEGIKEDLSALDGRVEDLEESGGSISGLSSLVVDFSSDITWERKTISASNGVASNSTTRIASSVIPKSATTIMADDGYKYTLAGYNGATYVGEWSGVEFAKTPTWFTGEIDISNFSNYNLRVVLAYNNDTAITLDGSSGMHFYAITDKTLSIQGKIADAKVVGDRFISTENIVETIKPAASFPSLFVESADDVSWSQGVISSSTGNNDNSSTRLRTGFLPKTITTILPDTDYKYCILAYNESVYIGEWDGTDFVKAPTWLTGYTNISAFSNYDLRLVFSRVIKGNISVEEASHMHFYKLTDNTLSISGKSADAKAVGDRFEEVEQKLTEKITDVTEVIIYDPLFTEFDVNTTGKYVSKTVDEDGVIVSTTTATKWAGAIRSLTGDFALEAGKKYRLTGKATKISGNPYMRIAVLGRADLETGPVLEASLFFNEGSGEEQSIEFVANSYMKSICLYVCGDSNVSGSVKYSDVSLCMVEYSAIDLKARTSTSQYVNMPESWGMANTLAAIRHVMNIKWTPVGNLPRNTGGYFPKSEQTGLPYSSARDQDKAIGMDVSIYTFMSTVRDPNSVLYKRRSTVYNSSAYYGTVCSGLVNYSLGLYLNLTNYYLSECDLFYEVSMQSIIPGDMLWIYGHCAMVESVTKDQYGRIIKVVTVEEWQPLPRRTVYSSFAAFKQGRAGYIAKRYKHMDAVPYTPIPWVKNFDEVPESVTYPDIQSDHGDKAVFMTGEDVLVNVIDPKDYTQIVVDRAGTTVQTLTTIESFTIADVQPGLYTITASDGENTSVSTFFVVSATCSFDTSTGIVAFSSTNATPVLVNVYNLPSDRNIVNKSIILTDADRSAGRLDVSSYMDSEYQYAKVTFRTDYGTAVWYSETHEKWVPIT